jgi:Rha family phage regulatory protein
LLSDYLGNEGSLLGAFTLKSNVPVTNSRDVAAFFGKRHADILRALDALDCSPEFNERNFASVDYLDGKGERRRSIDMTKDGFVFLVMGFTGRKAAAFKEAYIARFNEMEAELRARQADKCSDCTCSDLCSAAAPTLLTGAVKRRAILPPDRRPILTP